jgi:hypothetical protein
MKNTSITQSLLCAFGLLLLSQQCGQSFYDPGLQRWINRDPIGERGGLTLYRYVYNNPLSWFDRDGLVPDAFTPPARGLPPDHALPSLGDMGKAGSLVWNSPNTVLGLELGLLGLPFGGSTPTVGNNALQFENNPLMFGGDITLGNVICYRKGMGPKDPLFPGSPYNFGDHERQHTYQGEQLGPLYLPAYGIFGINSLLHGGDFFGPGNRMETGPYLPETQSNTPPRPWP